MVFSDTTLRFLQCYNPASHPDVASGRMSPDDAFDDLSSALSRQDGNFEVRERGDLLPKWVWRRVLRVFVRLAMPTGECRCYLLKQRATDGDTVTRNPHLDSQFIAIRHPLRYVAGSSSLQLGRVQLVLYGRKHSGLWSRVFC